ncbi:MAG TPA: translocation/assembly module TamB domain-containing protein [Gemmatimonadaceae bacterium]|nr:translocation/assembly module TamB domain-containing protein [Gemmatimonadaceae bacterium]
MRKGLVIFFASITGLALLALIGVFVLTNTDWGREQVRNRALSSLQNSAHGIVKIGRVSGNLLKGFTLHDLVITDSSGAPFVIAAEAHARYGLRSLTSKRVEFDDVRLVRPVIVLDRKSGGIWNYDRIFPRDTMTPQGPRRTGWGTVVRFTDVIIVDGDLTVRSPWEPDSRMTGAEREDALRRAFGPEGRLVIDRVTGGYQKVSKFHRINASIPLLRLEDPAYRNRLANVASLSMIAEPFKPPMADIRSLSGGFEFNNDSVWWQGARIGLPGSRLAGNGRYNLRNSDFALRLEAKPVALADVRWVSPRIPERGSGTLDFRLDWVGDTSIYVARNADVQIADARLRGDLGLTMSEKFELHDTNLRFANLDTRLIQQIFPIVKPPRHGILSGRAKLDGNQESMDVDGDVTFDDRRSGRNRVLAVGHMGFGDGEFNADNLRLTMRPVQVDLVREFAPNLPLRGTLAGTATLNGSTRSRMSARADVTHVDRGSVSRVTGTGALRKPGGATLASSWFDIDARVHPLSLVTVGRFAPAAGLRGSATGPVRLTGSMRNLAVRSDLSFTDGGTLGLTGTLDLASREKGYDVDIVANLFNANAIIAKAPPTSITATASADGRGFKPETMRATLVADVQSSTYDTLAVTSARIRVAAADGMARVDTLAVEIPQGIANASGTFGLARGRSGELRYHVDVDSLHRLASLLPPQEGVVLPRPGILGQRVSRARSDSARIAKATEVERAATGKAPPTIAAVDSPRVISRSELSGSIVADGVATGNIRDFGLKGTATGESIIARGNSVERIFAEYTWGNALTPQSNVSVNAVASNLVAGGFDLDSVETKITYRKPAGTASVVVRQDDRTSYSANADYTLNKVRNELRLNQMQLRFDSTVWGSTRASVVHWGTAGIHVDKLELKNASNGRIYIDGLIPKEGRANLEVAVDNFAVEDVIRLAQSDIDARGLLSFDMKAAGTGANPTFSGAFGTQNFYYNGSLVPELHGVVSYANQTLTGRADAMREGRTPFLFAEGTIPINLALSGVTGPRLPRDRQIDLAIRADSLPLDLVPQVNTIVTNLQGKAVANFKVGGTLSRPELTGNLVFDDAKARIVPLGINLAGLDASIRMERDTIVVDSLVAHTNGRIAVTGGIGIGSLREPSFDLKLFANNARVLDNDKGKLTADIDVTVKGPFNDTHLDGALRVRGGVLYIPKSEGKKIISTSDPALFNVLDTAVASNRELLPEQSPLLANLRMDVALRVDRDVFVRSPDFNIEVYSDDPLLIHVNRAKQSLVLDGILLSERGEYSFLSKRFDIKRGSATFVNTAELNPTLQVTGGYEVRLPAREAINIEILIGGTLRNPQISLESDAQPPIPQSDLLSYLAFGQRSSSLLQLEGSGLSSSEDLVGAGAALASRQLAAVALGVFTDQLAGEAARSVGADVLNIAPADIQSDVGSFLRATEVEFGKYIKSHTFIAARLRPDPQALKRPGLDIEHRFGGLKGYSLQASFQPRYLLREPTLSLQDPITTSVLGLFLIREWRY